MRGVALLVCVITSTAAAQQAVPAPAAPDSARAESAHVVPVQAESVHAESTRAESVPLFAAPTPAQARYMDGLKTAGRGVAQLKEGANRVALAERNPVRLHREGLRLAGWCGTAARFMASGRAKMVPTAYEDSTRIMARRLAARIDTLMRLVPTCETNASKQPEATATLLVKAVTAYETALRDFRAAIGLPVGDKSPR